MATERQLQTNRANAAKATRHLIHPFRRRNPAEASAEMALTSDYDRRPPVILPSDQLASSTPPPFAAWPEFMVPTQPHLRYVPATTRTAIFNAKPVLRTVLAPTSERILLILNELHTSSATNYVSSRKPNFEAGFGTVPETNLFDNEEVVCTVDRNEAQMMYLEKGPGGWKISRADSDERVKTLIPYGTPVK